MQNPTRWLRKMERSLEVPPALPGFIEGPV
jgi:hypothetical protein